MARAVESAKKDEKDKDKEFERLASAAKATAEKQKRRKIRYTEFTSNTPNPHLSINPHESLDASPALNKVRATG